MPSNYQKLQLDPRRQARQDSSKLRNYELAVIGGLLVGIICALLYVTVSHISGFIAISLGTITLGPIFATIIGTTILISAIVSGASYIGRAVDTFTGERTIIDLIRMVVSKTNDATSSRRQQYPQPKVNNEGIATIVGVTIGLAFGLLLIFGGITIPFISALGILPKLIFMVVTISQFAGLCARIGRVFDRWFEQSTIFHSQAFHDMIETVSNATKPLLQFFGIEIPQKPEDPHASTSASPSNTTETSNGEPEGRNEIEGRTPIPACEQHKLYQQLTQPLPPPPPAQPLPQEHSAESTPPLSDASTSGGPR